MAPHHHYTAGSGAPWSRGGFGPLLDVAQQLRGLSGASAQRARRGDVRAAILRLLAEEPMHGYQVIAELTNRSGGAWSPSAGSVYPTLQLLADEGLVVAEPVGGRKVYRLTEAGTDAAAQLAGRSAPWEDAADHQGDGSGYHQAVGRLMQAVFQVGRTGSAHQLTAGAEVLQDARRRLYAILAED
ncbi:PadR family transcriptional regulator [Ornithinimicrobium sp. W1679]|uniref:PadR family transcriptional regulator n=1 Tax=unclassified Ornithinimicrobium TaxID=2615080 RepID=UPI003CEEE49E